MSAHWSPVDDSARRRISSRSSSGVMPVGGLGIGVDRAGPALDVVLAHEVVEEQERDLALHLAREAVERRVPDADGEQLPALVPAR